MMADYEIVSIVMGFVVLGIAIFFGVGLFVIYKLVKKKVHSDKKIQDTLQNIAENYGKDEYIKHMTQMKKK